jgi:hypothetical protein
LLALNVNEAKKYSKRRQAYPKPLRAAVASGVASQPALARQRTSVSDIRCCAPANFVELFSKIRDMWVRFF